MEMFESIDNFSLFSEDCPTIRMEDLTLFPEAQLSPDFEDELLATIEDPMLSGAETLSPCSDTAEDNALNKSTVSKTMTRKPKIVQILIAQPTQNGRKENTNQRRGKSAVTVAQNQSHNGLSKNALAARENRIKKKKKEEEMQTTLAMMTNELRILRSKTVEQEHRISSLQHENRYLKNVIANTKEISALLKTVKNTPGVTFHGSSINSNCSLEDSSSDDSQFVQQSRKRRRPDYSLSSTYSSEEDEELVGVCLHVNSGSVSLEFCPTCSSRAAKSILEPH